MTDLSLRAAAPGARSPFASLPRRRWLGLLPGLLATLLLNGLGSVVTTQKAEAAPRARTWATVVRQAEARPPQRRVNARRHVTPQRIASSTVITVPPASILLALQRAEAATGANPALLLAIARRESGFDPAARNHRSSARGLMQFTSATWLEVVRDFGQRHGLAQHAVALSAAACRRMLSSWPRCCACAMTPGSRR
jgi:soluble lytic murein transglycosylase-like protein